ncbi:MAG: DUF2905 domain-containing protein [Armatimonadota bacterium]
MTGLGKLLIGAGIVLVLAGGLLWALGRVGFRGLPGDLKYETNNVRVYFPIATSILISVLLTAGLWLWQWLSRR